MAQAEDITVAAKPRCFVIMPFGRGSDEEQHYLDVYDHIIAPPIEEAGFTCERGDQIPNFGPIPDQVLEKLRDYELVVADLTAKRMNVFYELGFRHALSKDTITIAEDPDSLPFNVRVNRTLKYSLGDVRIADRCRQEIRDAAVQIRASIQRREAGDGEPEDPYARLENLLTIGLSNIGGPLADLHDRIKREFSGFAQRLAAQEVKYRELEESLTRTTHLGDQISDTGLVGIYVSRGLAIEREFYRVMQDETRGISIVGSTIYGLTGDRKIPRTNILHLLESKAADSEFHLRILLTHWDHISGREDQEKGVKNVSRRSIAQELLDAIRDLERYGLRDHVRFYKGSPTCFTILCDSQQLMLANPYSYQREAFTGWTAIFRDVPGGVYAEFRQSHVDDPWQNHLLTEEITENTEELIRTKYGYDS